MVRLGYYFLVYYILQIKNISLDCQSIKNCASQFGGECLVPQSISLFILDWATTTNTAQKIGLDQYCLLFQITNTREGVFSIFRISEYGIKGRKKQKCWLSPRNVTQARPHPVHVDLQLRGAGPPRSSVEPAGFCDVLLYLWMDHRVSVIQKSMLVFLLSKGLLLT